MPILATLATLATLAPAAALPAPSLAASARALTGAAPVVSEAPLGEAAVLVVLGALFLLGLGADLLGRHSFLPRVTLLMLGGITIGPFGFGLIPERFVEEWFPLLTDIALGMIGFLLGEKVALPALRERGRTVIGISVGKVLGAFALVGGALLVAGVPFPIALLLAGIAPATAPAATYDVIRETGARGEFPDTLLSVVAIDDAWGLMLFTLTLATTGALLGSAGFGAGLTAGLLEIGGSLVLGIGAGLPMAALTGRIRKGEPTQAEALGMVFLLSGVAMHLEVSPILAAMAMGGTVATRAAHHRRPFHAIEGIEWPFLIAFFVLAGASLELDLLREVGWLGAGYIGARCIGLYFGCRTACRLVGTSAVVRRWLGLTLFPQAGVAIGMALIASQRFPREAGPVLSVVLTSTIVFELTAPVVTRRVLRVVAAAGEGVETRLSDSSEARSDSAE